MNRPIGAGVGLIAGLLVFAGGPAAMAAPFHPGHAAQRHASSHGPGHGRKGQRFNLTGLVTAANGTSLQVLVAKGSMNGKQLATQSVSIVLSPHRNHPASASVGDTIRAQGTADPQTGQLDASTFEVQSSATSAMVGLVDAVNGTTISLHVSAVADPGGQGDQGDHGVSQSEGRHGGGEDVAVDVAQASVSVDGQPAALAQLATGETVAILGQRDDQSALASQVLAYSTAPGIAEGTLTQVNGNVLTLSTRHDDHEIITAAVDVTSSLIVLDGQSGATVSQLNPGDQVLAVGTAGSNPLAAMTIFAFDRGQNGQRD